MAKRQKNDTTNLTLPKTPYEVSKNLDLDDPVQADRSVPRIPVKKTRASKPVDLKYGPDPDLLPAHVRRLRWPELFEIRYAVDLIKSMRQSVPVDRDIDAWVEEVIASGVPEDHRSKFLVAQHPGFPRLALFELVTNPKEGNQAYKCISIFMTKAKDGYLPPDLDTTDKRWRHLRGHIGDFRRPTRRDFEIIREDGDRRTAQTKSGKTRGADAVTLRHIQRTQEKYNEVQRQTDDYVIDMLDYGYLWLNAVANGGKQYSVATITPQNNPILWKYEKKNGYQIKQRRTEEEIQEMKWLIDRINDAAKKHKERAQRRTLGPNEPVQVEEDVWGEKPLRTLDIGHMVQAAEDDIDLKEREIGAQVIEDDYIERRLAERRARIARGDLVTK